MGQNEALIKLVDEAKHDVCLFFENAFKGLGQNKYEKVEDLAHEATAIFIEKVAEGSGGCEPEEKGSSSKNICSSGGKAEDMSTPAIDEALKNDICIPTACEYATPVNQIARAVEQGLDELVRKGISVEQFVGEAVLEAATNIIEDAAAKVVNENLSMNKGMQSENIPGAETGAVVVEETETNMMQEAKGKEVCGEGGNGDQAQDDSSMEKEESSQSMSFRTWAENLKNKAGEDSGLVKAIDEAKREVDYFFQLAFKELGKEIYEECTDGLVKKANEIFVSKLVREGTEIDSRLKKELGWIDKDSSATKKSESEGSSNASSKKKGRVIKTSNDWVGVAEEFMRQDKGFESKVEEALKAVNDYLWTVFDKEKNAYLEEKKIRAVRAAAIFLDIVKDSPVWGAENELLGRILKANRELIGGGSAFGLRKTLLIWLAVLKLLTDEQKGVIKLAVIK
nr:hypothetical protein Iba_chr13bCG16220 [Ipomoea batatas]